MMPAMARKATKPTKNKPTKTRQPAKKAAPAKKAKKAKKPAKATPAKAKAKATPAQAAAAAPESGIPFPFIGAGEASYFEWADLHIYFTREPTPAERTKIAKTVPPPIGDVAWKGRHLYLSSEQGVGRQIQAAYSKPPKQPTSLTTTSRFKIPDGPKLSRFNADTERWLLEAHGIVPILAAYRRQDWEAGGTTLSPWHHQSLPLAEAVLAQLAPKDGDSLEYMVRGIQAELEAAASKR